MASLTLIAAIVIGCGLVLRMVKANRAGVQHGLVESHVFNRRGGLDVQPRAVGDQKQRNHGDQDDHRQRDQTEHSPTQRLLRLGRWGFGQQPFRYSP